MRFIGPKSRRLVLSALLLALWCTMPVAAAEKVVVYCAQDQVFAQPILREFQEATGITVLAVYDSEAVKTVGLANRLLAERRRPRCDVFWGNEEMRTRQLVAEGVFETNGWASFGYRSRRIVVNTNLLSTGDAPKSLLELTNKSWRGKAALAYPQFGTTATHFHALKFEWGDATWRAWCKSLAANEPLLVDGNSAVVKMVGRGEALVGLTDSDDISAGIREGLPLAAVPVSRETLYIPNTVALVRNGPHPKAARELYEHLRSGGVANALVSAHALQGTGSPKTPGLEPKWDLILKNLEQTTSELRAIFLE